MRLSVFAYAGVVFVALVLVLEIGCSTTPNVVRMTSMSPLPRSGGSKSTCPHGQNPLLTASSKQGTSVCSCPKHGPPSTSRESAPSNFAQKNNVITSDSDLSGLPLLVPPVTNSPSSIKQVSDVTVLPPPLPIITANSATTPLPQHPGSIPSFSNGGQVRIPMPHSPIPSKHYVEVPNRASRQTDVVATLFPTMVELTSRYDADQNHCPGKSSEPTNIFVRKKEIPRAAQYKLVAKSATTTVNADPTPNRSGTPTLPPSRKASPAQTASVLLATYQQPVSKHQSPTKTAVGMSSELTKPWDIDKIQKRSADGSAYRLVSETQSDRLPSPSDGVVYENNVLMTAQSGGSASPRIHHGGAKLPIFNIGKTLAKEFHPSNDRKWTPNHAVLQTADMNGNVATVHNIRYSLYESQEKYTTRYYDASFNLNDIRTLDIIIVPFRAAPRVAHVESSFGFADGRYLGMSIEARYEEGEKYDPVGAGLNQFELIYIFADERDLIRLGTDVHKNEVEVYRLRLEPSEVREIFVAALLRANKLAEKPEFYHPLKNSCVTNLIGHINKAKPNAIPWEYRTLLPGLMAGYLYDIGMIATTATTFKEAKENAKVNWLVEKYGDLEYFSAGIRQNMY